MRKIFYQAALSESHRAALSRLRRWPCVKGPYGFTLVELLAVVAILAVLASIAIPIYTGYQKSSARQEATSNLQGLSVCLEQYYSENTRYNPVGDGNSVTYNWSMNSSGTITSNATGSGTSMSTWLPCFQPQKSTGGLINRYSYALVIYNSTANSSTNMYNATASGTMSPVTGDTGTSWTSGNSEFYIDSTGLKNGPWSK